MTPVRRLGLVLTIGVAFIGFGRAAAQKPADEILTNQAVIAMTTAKLDRALVLSKISSAHNTFDVSVGGLVNLTQANVHPEIVLRMITMAADSKLGQRPSGKTAEVLENPSIVSLVGGKVNKSVIFAKIQNTKTAFDVSSEGLVSLTQGKVPSDVIKAMIVKAGTDGNEIRISLSADVLFDFDKSEVKPAAEPSLTELLSVIKSHPDATVEVEGHTDAKGRDDYNQALSEKRATAVAQWLVGHGNLASSSIHARGFGKTKPIAPNAKPDGSDDPDGRAKNRRVEIVVKK